MAQKEQCFIITPIGDDNSEIRRHIEGIIDAVIKPALENQYEVVVAHRISTPGSITKQIIDAIYNSKLVIANLTNCNPNVMYELALRHGIGKPVIMIAVEGTRLPSDIMMQRTIFYRNDALGVLELREKLKNTANKIDFEKKCGLVFEALGEISHDAAMLKKVAERDSGSQEPLKYIMQRLDRIESMIPSKTDANIRKPDRIEALKSVKTIDNAPKVSNFYSGRKITMKYAVSRSNGFDWIKFSEGLQQLESQISGFRINALCQAIDPDDNHTVELYYDINSNIKSNSLVSELKKLLTTHGIRDPQIIYHINYEAKT